MSASKAVQGDLVDVGEPNIVAKHRGRGADKDRTSLRLVRVVRRLWSRGEAIVPDDAELELQAAVADTAPVEDEAYADGEPDRAWLQTLWGPGFVTPGGEDYVIASIKSLALTAAVNLLELEPGLGGSTRVIAKEAGCWVTGFESDAELAAEAMDLSSRAGFAKKAVIKALNPVAPGFTAKTFDHCYAKDGILEVADKPALYKAVHKALKPNGKFVFGEFVVRKGAESDPAFLVLGKNRAAPRGLWNRDDLLAALGKSGFGVKEADTTSDAIERAMIRSWLALTDRLKTEPVSANKANMIINECIRWVRVSALLRDGALEHVSVRAARV
ncbi:MAG: methyltransferase domain-containing protein [Alphaproteobacteria bacterium]